MLAFADMPEMVEAELKIALDSRLSSLLVFLRRSFSWLELSESAARSFGS